MVDEFEKINNSSCDNININHLNFLFVDSYINKIEFENLKKILEKRDYYRSI